MKNSVIYLTRHGQTEWNVLNKFQGRLDSPLTIKGEIQAKQTRDLLSNKNIHVSYSSPLLRALNTARIITANRPIKSHVHDDLSGMRLDPWQGKTLVEISKTNPEEYYNFYKNPDKFNLPGCENYHDLQGRVVNIVGDILIKYKSHNILIVTHGIVIKALLAYLSTQSVAGIANVDLMANGSFVTLKKEDEDI